MSIFERAARGKYRFGSVKGALTTEQLWDVPLSSTDGFDLEGVAQSVDAELSGLATSTFVNINPDPKKAARKATLETMLEIVKRVIAVKIEEKEAADKKRANAAKRQQLLEALAEREAGDLKAKSKEELLKELNELDG